MPDEENNFDEPLYEPEICPECGEPAENMEWEDEMFICPNCGEVQ